MYILILLLVKFTSAQRETVVVPGVGTLRGAIADDIVSFKSIRYAYKPLRFRPVEAHHLYPEDVDADNETACYQAWSSLVPVSEEDCLVLSIYKRKVNL